MSQDENVVKHVQKGQKRETENFQKGQTLLKKAVKMERMDQKGSKNFG